MAKNKSLKVKKRSLRNDDLPFILKAFLQMKRKRFGVSYQFIFNTCLKPEEAKEIFYDSWLSILEDAIYEHNKAVINKQHDEKCFFQEINSGCPIPNEIIKVKAKSDFDRFYVLKDLEDGGKL
jgi:ribonucleotide reductase beta subunit family protein with ferritin-like domain